MTVALFRSIFSEIAELKRRLAGVEIRGKVTDVDHKNHRLRFEMGKDDDGETVKSPWIPYAQKAGALKVQTKFSVGETIAARSESGDVEQATAYPSHWNNENAAPSDSEDGANIITFGPLTITLADDGIHASIGGTSFQFTADGFSQQGGQQIHDGKDVGSTHRHGGVVKGAQLTDEPT